MPILMSGAFRFFLFAALRQDDAGNLGVPLQNHLLQVDIPGFFSKDLRLNGRLAFQRFSNSAYYGFGNRTEPAPFTEQELNESEIARRFDRYDRIYPNLALNLRYMLYKVPKELGRRRFELFFGLNTIVSFIDVYEGSRLEEDLAVRDSATDVRRRREPAGAFSRHRRSYPARPQFGASVGFPGQ